MVGIFYVINNSSRVATHHLKEVGVFSTEIKSDERYISRR